MKNCRYGGLRWTVLATMVLVDGGLGTTTCGDGGKNRRQLRPQRSDACVEDCRVRRVCDGLDNDCDGFGRREASEPQPVAMASAKEQIINFVLSVVTPCVEGTAGTEEVCDGLDNDCDGFVDGASEPQPVGDGECERTVVTVLGVVTPCVEGTAGTEVCDGLGNGTAMVWSTRASTCGDGGANRRQLRPRRRPLVEGTAGTEVCDKTG
jgi:hypothetical protein